MRKKGNIYFINIFNRLINILYSPNRDSYAIQNTNHYTFCILCHLSKKIVLLSHRVSINIFFYIYFDGTVALRNVPV
jgi:hypothetical protein